MPTSVNSGYACCRGVILAVPAVETVLDDVEQRDAPGRPRSRLRGKAAPLALDRLRRFGNIYYHDAFPRLVVALTARPYFPARRHRHTPQDLKSS